MLFEKPKKRKRNGKHHKINEVLFEQYKRFCTSNIYSNGVILKEEAIAIKEQLQNSEFDDFNFSNGQLDCWKTTYSAKDRRIVGDTGGVSTETVTSWMEGMNKLTEGYSLGNVWNMVKSVCCF